MSPQKKQPQKKAPEPHFNLHLTSPHHMSDKQMGGNLIHRAQQALHANRFGEFYHPNHNDGVYGPETAASAKHAKYALGFPDKDVNLIFNDALWVRLTGERPLGTAYEKRRKARRKPAQPSGSKVKAVDLALKEVGYREGAGNCTKYGEWYGLHCAYWCAMFVSWCEGHAGNSWFHYSYCPTILSAAMHGDHGMSLTQNPEKGDLVLFGSPPHHVGLVVSRSPWRWVSGNWGDHVAVSTERPADLSHFVHMPTH